MAFANWNTALPVTPALTDPRRASWTPVLRKAYFPGEGPLRILVLGDSRATSPTGAGRYLHAALQGYSHALFGNTPATIWSKNTTGGNVAHSFMVATSYNTGGVGTPTKLTKAKLLPGQIALSAHSFGGGEYTDGAGTWGTPSFSYMFKPSNQQGAPFYPNRNIGSTSAPTWFNYTTDQVYIDVMMGTFSGAIPVQYDVMRTNTTSRYDGGAFPNSFANGEWSDLDAAEGYVVKTLGPYTLGGFAGLQLRLKGKTGRAGTFVHLGTRVRMATKTTGIEWIFSGCGGYKATDITTNHTAMGPMLRTMNPDIIMVLVDTNDIHSGAGISAATFKTNLMALLASLRASSAAGLGREVPIVLPSGCYRYDETSASKDAFKTEWDQVPGVMEEIANTLPMTMHINLRKITEYMGFNATNTDMGGSRPVGASFVGDFPGASSATAGQFGYFTKTNLSSTSFIAAPLWKALNNTDTWTATDQNGWPTSENNGAKAYSAFQDWYMYRWWVSDGFHTVTNTAGTYTITSEDAVHLSPEACWTIAPLILFNIFGLYGGSCFFAGPAGSSR